MNFDIEDDDLFADDEIFSGDDSKDGDSLFEDIFDSVEKIEDRDQVVDLVSGDDAYYEYIIDEEENDVVDSKLDTPQIDEPEADGSYAQELSYHQKEYELAKADYYRLVLRKEDEKLLKRIQKIPDSWEEPNVGNRDLSSVADETKKRLSDIKKTKSWELKFESLNIYFVSTIEERFLSCLSHKSVTAEQIKEARECLIHLKMEVEGNPDSFKDMIYSLAKRAVSDFYYLALASFKFYKNRTFNIEKDIPLFVKTWDGMFQLYETFDLNIEFFKSKKQGIDSLFSDRKNFMGWKLNDFKVKEFFEENHEEMDKFIENVKLAYLFKRKLKQDYDFLRYYYNGKDGKLFRYNFIVGLLYEKLQQGLIDQSAYDSFKRIRDNFISMKDYLEAYGLMRFGHESFTYKDLMEYIYKGGKIVESYYLRNQNYEELRNYRDDLLHSISLELEHYQQSIKK